MVKAWLLVVLLLVPGVAAGQLPINPAATTPSLSIDVPQWTPPPPTIPSAPKIALPSPPPAGTRPVKTFDFRPTLGASEEYSDNFNRTSQNPISNFRSTIFPGFQALLDTGFLTGQATYTLSGFYDSSVNQLGVHNVFAGQLAWQATPRLRFTVSDALTQGDDPAQADQLNLRLTRQEFTSNLLSLSSDYSIATIDTTEYYRFSTFTSNQETTTAHTLGATGSAPLGRIHTVTLGYEYLDSQTTGSSSDSGTTGGQVTGSFSRDLTKDRTAGVSAAYASREQTGASGPSSFTRWNISLFTNYVVPDKIIIRGNIGVAQLNSGGSKPKTLLTTNTDIAYYLGPAILGLKLENGFTESFAQGQNLGVVETTGYAGSVSYRFSPLVTSLVTLSYRENKFTGIGGGQAGQVDKTVTVTANLTYQVLRWLTATMDYTFTDTKSSVPQTGFVENRVRAALNATLY